MWEWTFRCNSVLACRTPSWQSVRQSLETASHRARTSGIHRQQMPALFVPNSEYEYDTIVFAGAFGSILHGLLSPSPNDPTRTLLSFDLAMLLLPAMLFGIAIGVCMNSSSRDELGADLLTLTGWSQYVQASPEQGQEHVYMEVLARSRRTPVHVVHSAGVVLNPLSPEWVQTTLLSCLLVAITQKTVNQGVRHWRAEQAARQQ